MNKIITLIAGILVSLFLTLSSCVGVVGYADYDYPYGHHYYYGAPYYGGIYFRGHYDHDRH